MKWSLSVAMSKNSIRRRPLTRQKEKQEEAEKALAKLATNKASGKLRDRTTRKRSRKALESLSASAITRNS
jgi:hypothetical protein